MSDPQTSEWRWWLRHYENECHRLSAKPDPERARELFRLWRSPLAAAKETAARDNG